ncbi:hypothetical protein K458DRAFT_289773 [Lentithecium fluviatile CBS 122367]|uniref:Ribonuclease P/MRP protein subunit POP5 n=1 Tax=Lentithecium fluviatile CBS 122367 TaxID=1168545 RepID=A0A6G1JIY7_9PLEO|nr:hypothetical protein K458DRAFT_289773 [Lentithecium fluviatile CBS 122367]
MVRVKNRYLVVSLLYPAASTPGVAVVPVAQFHAPTPDAVHPGQFMRMLRDGIAELFGNYGAGMVNNALKVNYWSPATSTAIIRCPREHYQMVWAALTFVTKLPKPANTPVVVKVVRVSGTIRKAEEEVIRRAKLLIQSAKAAESPQHDPMMESVVRAVDRRRELESTVLAQVDPGEESESESE